MYFSIAEVDRIFLLYATSCQNVKFEFIKIQLDAFNKFKEKLVKAPVSTIYSTEASTAFYCDACSKGCSAAFLQKQKAILFRPISNFIKKFRKWGQL